MRGGEWGLYRGTNHKDGGEAKEKIRDNSKGQMKRKGLGRSVGSGTKEKTKGTHLVISPIEEIQRL